MRAEPPTDDRPRVRFQVLVEAAIGDRDRLMDVALDRLVVVGSEGQPSIRAAEPLADICAGDRGGNSPAILAGVHHLVPHGPGVVPAHPAAGAACRHGGGGHSCDRGTEPRRPRGTSAHDSGQSWVASPST